MKIIVLGAGMVGRAIALDLAHNFNITSVDINQDNLNQLPTGSIATINKDLSKIDEISALVQPYDIVVSCVPGFMGYKTVQASIEAKKPTVDISFMPEDFMELNDLAIKNNVPAIVDCGVAPGMPNLILGYHNSKMEVNNFFYMVGGLPKTRNLPFQYKAPFSPIDVLEEYTRPARFKENGKIITKPAMSDSELYRFENVGDLEGFNTDGLRSLLSTMQHIPNMKEKTLRYPGHIQLIQALKSSGFFSNKSLDVDGNKVVPMNVTSKILIEDWKLEPNEPEFTVMRIILTGIQNGKPKSITYDLYDEYDAKTEQWSMARTTGYTATAAVDLIASGNFKKNGVFPLELVGANEDNFQQIMRYLKERDINYNKTEK
ncbi:MAG: saccharopine dehydrogenase C-terminal domain-containing protein [Perlabentimonas sp.]